MTCADLTLKVKSMDSLTMWLPTSCEQRQAGGACKSVPPYKLKLHNFQGSTLPQQLQSACHERSAPSSLQTIQSKAPQREHQRCEYKKAEYASRNEHQPILSHLACHSVLHRQMLSVCMSKAQVDSVQCALRSQHGNGDVWNASALRSLATTSRRGEEHVSIRVVLT